VGRRAVLNVVVKRKIRSPRRESNPRTPIVHPVADKLLTIFTKHPVSPGFLTYATVAAESLERSYISL